MTNAWTWREKSKATVFPACSSWLNFRVRGQFEIKILIVSHINTTYFIWIFKKIKLEPAIIWKPVPCQRITSTNTWPPWVDTWARDTVKSYWSADTLFWQLSIDHIVNVQCKGCGLGKTRLRHPSLPFDSLPYPTRTIRRAYVRTYARSITWQPKEKRLTIICGYGALSHAIIQEMMS